MSIQSPPKFCQPGNGFFARLTCFIQSKVEWLCEKDEPDLNSEQRFELSRQYNSMPICGGIYKLANDLPFQSAEFQRKALAEYMHLCPQLVVSEWVHATLAPVIPFRAKIAMAFWRKFTYGTDCHCCIAIRILTLFFFGVICGAAIGNL